LKRVDWVSKSSSPNHSTANDACDTMVEFDSGVAGSCLRITRIHLRVTYTSKIVWWPATFHNTGQMDHAQVHHGLYKAITILDSVDVETVYGYSPLHYHIVQ
jgi:hypothetical protein